MNTASGYLDLFNITPSIIDNLSSDQVVQTDSNGNLISLAVDLASDRVSGILPISNSESKVVSLVGSLGRIVITGTDKIPIINIDLSYVGQNSISILGSVTIGDWKANVIGTTYTESKLKSISAVLNRTLISGTSTDSIIDISSNYVGQSSLTTLGTISSGIWNASAIDGKYINYTTSNLKVTSNQLNTIQNISTTDSPAFKNLTIGLPGIAGVLNLPNYSNQIYMANKFGNGTYINCGTMSLSDSDRVISIPYSTNNANFVLTESFTAQTINASMIYTNNQKYSNLTASLPLQLDASNNLISSANNLVTSITGTSNQIIASSSTGNIVLSTPQNINTTSSPSFANVTASSTITSTFVRAPSIDTNSNVVLTLGAINCAAISIGRFGIDTHVFGTFSLLDYDPSLPLQLDSSSRVIASAANLVTSIAGTSSQIIASGSTGNITLSLPQDIDTSSTVRFGKLGLNTTPVSYAMFQIDGTQNNSDGFNSICTLINPTISLSTSSTFAKSLEVRLNPSTSSGTISIAAGIFVDNGTSGSNVTDGYGLYVSSINYGTNRYAAFFDGKVGIKISNPTTDLQLNADLASKPSTNTWQITSDQRIKSNIQDLDLDTALNDINAIKIRTFSYIPEYKQQCSLSCVSKRGVIADELEAVMPCCVSTNIGDTIFGKTETNPGITIPNLKSVQMDEVYYTLIAAVQKLSQRNDELMTRIVNLEAKLI